MTRRQILGVVTAEGEAEMDTGDSFCSHLQLRNSVRSKGAEIELPGASGWVVPHIVVQSFSAP